MSAAEAGVAPESTALRVALWRALHVQLDAAPHVLADDLGYRLAAPEPGWRERPDMHPDGTRGIRAAIVARGRFVDDLLAERVAAGVTQFVVLGAGLDTVAQRIPDLAGRVRVFEVDQPGPQEWKRGRLHELGYGVPDWLNLVPVDFEADEDWWERLHAAGFDATRPALVASTGVSMYLSREATAATLHRIAGLPAGSTLAMTFLLPADALTGGDRENLARAEAGARASGTPFVSFYPPEELLALARDAGFRSAAHVSGATLGERYFAGRADGLRPSGGEDFLVAGT